MTRREIEDALDDLKEELQADEDGDERDPRDGITADFIAFSDEDGADPPDDEDRGASFIAFTENTEDADEEESDE